MKRTPGLELVLLYIAYHTLAIVENQQIGTAKSNSMAPAYASSFMGKSEKKDFLITFNNQPTLPVHFRFRFLNSEYTSYTYTSEIECLFSRCADIETWPFDNKKQTYILKKNTHHIINIWTITSCHQNSVKTEFLTVSLKASDDSCFIESLCD